MGKGSLNRSTVVSKRKIDDITENTTSSNKHINKQIKAQKVQIKNHSQDKQDEIHSVASPKTGAKLSILYPKAPQK
jgi:cell division septum initiation protein DivIVA